MSNQTSNQNQAEASQQPKQQKAPQVLEEDDEFEDFPVEGARDISSTAPGFTNSTIPLRRTSIIPP